MACKNSAIFVLLLSSFLHAAPKDRPCRSTSFMAELKAGQVFEKAIGGDLIFQISTPADSSPWQISIFPRTSKQDDLIYPVNPPLRFNPLQQIGAGYDLDVKASLAMPRTMWFLLSKADFERLWPAVENALWPYNAPEPERAADEYLNLLGSVVKGQLKLQVLSSEIDPGTNSPRRIKFRTEIIVPNNFSLAPDLKSRPSACPKLEEFMPSAKE
jgi:hypothetical protein